MVVSRIWQMLREYRAGIPHAQVHWCERGTRSVLGRRARLQCPLARFLRESVSRRLSTAKGAILSFFSVIKRLLVAGESAISGNLSGVPSSSYSQRRNRETCQRASGKRTGSLGCEASQNAQQSTCIPLSEVRWSDTPRCDPEASGRDYERLTGIFRQVWGLNGSSGICSQTAFFILGDSKTRMFVRASTFLCLRIGHCR